MTANEIWSENLKKLSKEKIEKQNIIEQEKISNKYDIDLRNVSGLKYLQKNEQIRQMLRNYQNQTNKIKKDKK